MFFILVWLAFGVLGSGMYLEVGCGKKIYLSDVFMMIVLPFSGVLGLIFLVYSFWEKEDRVIWEKKK